MPKPKCWKIKKIPLSRLNMTEYNPRVIGDKAMKGLESSIKFFGYVEPIVWNKSTGNIVGGHQRYRVLMGEGIKEAFVVVCDLTEKQERAANLSLNNPHIQGEWDEKALDLIKEIEESDFDLYEALNIDALQKSLEESPPRKGGAESSIYDTTCPCCGHAWQLDADNVSLEGYEGC